MPQAPQAGAATRLDRYDERHVSSQTRDRLGLADRALYLFCFAHSCLKSLPHLIGSPAEAHGNKAIPVRPLAHPCCCTAASKTCRWWRRRQSGVWVISAVMTGYFARAMGSLSCTLFVFAGVLFSSPPRKPLLGPSGPAAPGLRLAGFDLPGTVAFGKGPAKTVRIAQGSIACVQEASDRPQAAASFLLCRRLRIFPVTFTIFSPAPGSLQGQTSRQMAQPAVSAK